MNHQRKENDSGGGNDPRGQSDGDEPSQNVLTIRRRFFGRYRAVYKAGRHWPEIGFPKTSYSIGEYPIGVIKRTKMVTLSKAFVDFVISTED